LKQRVQYDQVDQVCSEASPKISHISGNNGSPNRGRFSTRLVGKTFSGRIQTGSRSHTRSIDNVQAERAQSREENQTSGQKPDYWNAVNDPTNDGSESDPRQGAMLLISKFRGKTLADRLKNGGISNE
jgi:hypothetical protein